MSRVAIVGPGAVGGSMAAALSDSGAHEVILCSRRPLPKLVVETPTRTIEVKARVLTEPSEATPVDWILVATKAYDAAATVRWITGLGANGAPAAILQNGIEHRERFEHCLSADRILPVVVECPAEREEPGRIRQRRRATLTVPELALGRSFAALFAGTEVDIKLTPDFKSAAWWKLCINCAGILSTILLQPSGVTQDEAIGEALRQLVREAMAVGRAEGAVLADDLADEVLDRYRKWPADSLNSMHADRLAGRPMELEARNGVIVRLGRKHGIATPCHQMAIALLESMMRAKAH